MKFTISTETFLSLVSTVAPVVPSKPVLPVLSNALLVAEGNTLRVTATNMDQTISVTGAAMVTEPGRFTVNAKRLSALVREMPKGELSVSVEKEKFKIAYPNGKAEVMGIPATDYPAINGLGSDFKCTEVGMTSDVFQALTGTGGFCVATDRTRLALTGACLEIGGNAATMVSTDGHRLALSKLPLNTGETSVSVILPQESLSTAVKLCGAMELSGIGIGKGAVRFTFENAVLLTKTVEGPYPNYQQVIPTVFHGVFVTDTDEFARAVQRVKVLANSVTHKVELHFTENGSTISAEDMDTGGGTNERVDGTYNGAEFRIGLNADYLVEILRHIETPTVQMEMTGETGPCILRNGDECTGEAMALLMPLRLN